MGIPALRPQSTERYYVVYYKRYLEKYYILKIPLKGILYVYIYIYTLYNI